MRFLKVAYYKLVGELSSIVDNDVHDVKRAPMIWTEFNSWLGPPSDSSSSRGSRAGDPGGDHAARRFVLNEGSAPEQARLRFILSDWRRCEGRYDSTRGPALQWCTEGAASSSRWAPSLVRSRFWEEMEATSMARGEATFILHRHQGSNQITVLFIKALLGNFESSVKMMKSGTRVFSDLASPLSMVFVFRSAHIGWQLGRGSRTHYAQRPP